MLSAYWVKLTLYVGHMVAASLCTMLQLLWKGQEAFESALDLIAAAEHACKQTDATPKPFVWRQDILRPAADASQVSHLSTAILAQICLLAPCTFGQTV